MSLPALSVMLPEKEKAVAPLSEEPAVISFEAIRVMLPFE